MNPTTRDELRKAAVKWVEPKEQATEREWSSIGDKRLEAFIAGAEHERAKILELLRSEEAKELNPTTKECSCEIWTADGWSEWLEGKLNN
jgi:hypothetical protein